MHERGSMLQGPVDEGRVLEARTQPRTVDTGIDAHEDAAAGKLVESRTLLPVAIQTTWFGTASMRVLPSSRSFHTVSVSAAARSALSRRLFSSALSSTSSG